MPIKKVKMISKEERFYELELLMLLGADILCLIERITDDRMPY